MNFIQALSDRSRSTSSFASKNCGPGWLGPGGRWALLLMSCLVGCWCTSSETQHAQQTDSFRTMLKSEPTRAFSAQPVSHQITDQPATASVNTTILDQRAAERLQSRFAALEKPVREIHVVRADEPGPLPENHAAELLAPMASHVIQSDWHDIPTYDRYPVCFFHQPLHFEERNLERCGKGHGCLTNAVSTFWFLSNAAVWPYRMASEPHCQCVNSVGDCKTCQRYSCPVEPLHTDATRHELAKGVLAEAAVIAGFTFLVL
ncbi:MAG: hypothetical protein ACF8AM_24085 [Rhodopirellula sp. JB055]|uniref:hypothetical protein n=1 Tax=Rhodopirellula sp. JB055 TaxID=3342846 RepID=UPI00370B345D